MNRTVVITGASGSIGSETVRSMVSCGERVIMACRNLKKGESVRRSVLAEFPLADIGLMHLDLSSLSSVRGFVSALDGMRVDALFNNAGVISRGFRLSPDGIENTLATNYLGPYVLTRLLVPNMPEGSNVVNMVSLTCRFGNVDRDFFHKGEKDFRRLKTYSDTKLALLLFSVELSRRVPGIHVNVSDPGVVDSNMISMGKWFDPLADVLFRPFCNSPAKGAAPAVRALSTEADLNYFVGDGNRPVPSRYRSHPLASWLWDETARYL